MSNNNIRYAILGNNPEMAELADGQMTNESILIDLVKKTEDIYTISGSINLTQELPECVMADTTGLPDAKNVQCNFATDLSVDMLDSASIKALDNYIAKSAELYSHLIDAYEGKCESRLRKGEEVKGFHDCFQLNDDGSVRKIVLWGNAGFSYLNFYLKSGSMRFTIEKVFSKNDLWYHKVSDVRCYDNPVIALKASTSGVTFIEGKKEDDMEEMRKNKEARIIQIEEININSKSSNTTGFKIPTNIKRLGIS